MPKTKPSIATMTAIVACGCALAGEPYECAWPGLASGTPDPVWKEASDRFLPEGTRTVHVSSESREAATSGLVPKAIADDSIESKMFAGLANPLPFWSASCRVLVLPGSGAQTRFESAAISLMAESAGTDRKTAISMIVAHEAEHARHAPFPGEAERHAEEWAASLSENCRTLPSLVPGLASAMLEEAADFSGALAVSEKTGISPKALIRAAKGARMSLGDWSDGLSRFRLMSETSGNSPSSASANMMASWTLSVHMEKRPPFTERLPVVKGASPEAIQAIASCRKSLEAT